VKAGNVQGLGALVYDEKVKTKRPLLLVATNWLGVTEPAIKRAQRMAGDKYVALVADMYGEGKTCEGPPTSQEWMMAVRQDRVEGRKRVNAAMACLIAEADKRGIGDSAKKAAVGFCFGGGNVLELARRNRPARRWHMARKAGPSVSAKALEERARGIQQASVECDRAEHSRRVGRVEDLLLADGQRRRDHECGQD
jgi:dienelactone hydrolase